MSEKKDLIRGLRMELEDRFGAEHNSLCERSRGIDTSTRIVASQCYKH